MPHRYTALVLFALLPAPAVAGDGVAFFEAKVRPVLVEHCYSCHSQASGKSRGGLQLDSPAALRLGGDTGPAFQAGDETSLILQVLAHGPDAPAMPPKGKLPDRAVADFVAWVKMGAPLPQADGAAKPVAEAKPRGRDHWAFRPLPAAPPVNPIDRRIRAKLETQKLTPAPPAERRTLIRRLYFDLTGLPPTFEQVEAFAADSRPDAVENLVDALLATPAFGETWGRHWLDVARYAEDNPTNESTCRAPRSPHAYRDWVIGAFNADLPYPDFVRRQLAADLQPGLPPGEVAALGFLGLSPVYHKEPKLAADAVAAIVADEWDERVDAITRGFLGLTVSCARCHDHKFDPVSQADYTALLGVVANTELAERPLIADPGGKIADALTSVRRQAVNLDLRLGYAREMVGTARKQGQDATALREQARELAERLAEVKKRQAKLYDGPIAPAVRDALARVNGDDPAWTVVEYTPNQSRDLALAIRGNVAKPGEIVARRFLTVLSDGEPRRFQSGSGRRELAEAIVTDGGALAARVAVNRVWGWLFGRGLVSTPSNFGLSGEPPTHPELLDELAARFVAHGWSFKWLVREIVLSATYRQSSSVDTGRDPDNKWLARSPIKRLELEPWRDAMLTVAGRLDPRRGGPSDDLNDPNGLRRTVYGRVSRERPPDIHRLFDLPDPKTHGEKREPTITPLQQLYFLNSPFVRVVAAGVAKSVAGPCVDADEVVKALFRSVLLREPSPNEVVAALRLAGDGEPDWDTLAQALLVSNEFLYLE